MDEKKRSVFEELLAAEVAHRKNHPLTLSRKMPMTPAPKMDSELKRAAIDAVSAAFTEERTDALISKLTSKVPFWLRWLPIGTLLDRVLPEALIDWMEETL